MKRYRYKISLRLRHPSLDPTEITQALGLKPSQTWRAGEPRTTPKGRPLKGIYPDSGWTTRFADGEWPDTGLPTAIGNAVDQLAPHRDFFHRVRAEGGKAELFVGWEFDGQGGDVFDCALLARMADLRIDLSLDVYP